MREPVSSVGGKILRVAGDGASRSENGVNAVDIIFIAAGLITASLAILSSRMVRAILVETLAHPLRTATIIRDGKEVRVEAHHELSDRVAHS
jgi:hypothetical protein